MFHFFSFPVMQALMRCNDTILYFVYVWIYVPENRFESPTTLRFPNTLHETHDQLCFVWDKWISIFYHEATVISAAVAITTAAPSCMYLCVTRKPMPFPMLMVTLNHFFFLLFAFFVKYSAQFSFSLSFFLHISWFPAKETRIITTMAIIMCKERASLISFFNKKWKE